LEQISCKGKEEVKKFCVDCVLPWYQRAHIATAAIGGRARAISPIGKNWMNGSTIRIRFLGGTAAQHDMVKLVAPQWTRHANLHFNFTDDPDAEIRISFNPNVGAWSYVGLDNLSINKSRPTMNLGWQDQSVILHEFGHMIGLHHEHQNPDGGIQWNEAAVIRDLSGPPNNWDEATIRHNVLNKYDMDQVNGTEFDENSIMIYPFPDDWTSNTGTIRATTELSDIDKAFIASEKMYPKNTTPFQAATELPILEPHKAEISMASEEDIYRFAVVGEGEYLIETHGKTDTVMSLFGPDDPVKLVATDDDSGVRRNARISATLKPGRYLVRLTHYNPAKTGDYEISVTRR
jgi:hypothetical protein